MKLSYVINTCAADPYVRSSRRKHHFERGAQLEQRIIPAAIANADEVIVAGQWHKGSGYIYDSVAPFRRDRRDALYQRESGARLSTGDILVFGHDDHAVGEGFGLTLRRNWLQPESEEWDILVPKRTHALTGADMNNGSAESYMGGHVLVMRRWLWAAVPWTCVDTEYWDLTLTRIWREAGATIVFTTDLECFDLEATADES